MKLCGTRQSTSTTSNLLLLLSKLGQRSLVIILLIVSSSQLIQNGSSAPTPVLMAGATLPSIKKLVKFVFTVRSGLNANSAKSSPETASTRSRNQFTPSLSTSYFCDFPSLLPVINLTLQTDNRTHFYYHFSNSEKITIHHYYLQISFQRIVFN